MHDKTCLPGDRTTSPSPPLPRTFAHSAASSQPSIAPPLAAVQTACHHNYRELNYGRLERIEAKYWKLFSGDNHSFSSPLVTSGSLTWADEWLLCIFGRVAITNRRSMSDKRSGITHTLSLFAFIAYLVSAARSHSSGSQADHLRPVPFHWQCWLHTCPACRILGNVSVKTFCSLFHVDTHHQHHHRVRDTPDYAKISQIVWLNLSGLSEMRYLCVSLAWPKQNTKLAYERVCLWPEYSMQNIAFHPCSILAYTTLG